MPTSAKRTPAKSANGQSGSVSALKRKLREAERDRDLALWLHAELAFKVRSVIVRQMLENPTVRQQLEGQLIEKMGQEQVSQMLGRA